MNHQEMVETEGGIGILTGLLIGAAIVLLTSSCATLKHTVRPYPAYEPSDDSNDKNDKD